MAYKCICIPFLWRKNILLIWADKIVCWFTNICVDGQTETETNNENLFPNLEYFARTKDVYIRRCHKIDFILRVRMWNEFKSKNNEEIEVSFLLLRLGEKHDCTLTSKFNCFFLHIYFPLFWWQNEFNTRAVYS